MKAKVWYHCCSENHGDSFVAQRRPPILRTSKKPLTPRICVAPTVAGCFAAVAFKRNRPVYVYRTEKPRRGVMPVGVWDQFITHERWLIPPVTMVLDRVIPKEQVAEAQALIVEFHQLTGKSSNVILRFAQLAIAVKVLGGTTHQKQVIETLSKKWGWSDPRNVIIGEYLKAVG